MKQHLVVKLREGPEARIDAPAWRRFINDKSREITRLTPRFDAAMRDRGLGFWVTREYELLVPGGSADERAHGLDRTYRVILQRDADVPVDLVDRVAALPEVETVFPIRVAGAELPTPALATQASRAAGADLIQLAYAKLMTRGRRDVTIAVLDTGVDINHPELRDRVTKRMDFVDLNGLDTTDFVGDFLGLDDVPHDEVGHGTHVSAPRARSSRRNGSRSPTITRTASRSANASRPRRRPSPRPRSPARSTTSHATSCTMPMPAG